MSGKRRFQLAVLAVVLIGLAMRTLPQYLSPLPVKADGLFYASWAAETVGTGRLPLARVATDDLGFTSLIGAASLATGVDPWLLAGPMTALIGALPVLLVVALTRRLCRGRAWSVGRARLAGLLGGLFLAVEGLYLHRSMVTDEQTVGLFLVPLAVVALSRAYRSDRVAWWLVGGGLLAVLPPLHNLDAMVTGFALLLLVAILVSTQPLDRPLGRLVALTGAFGIAFPAYHLAVERFTPAVIVQQARFTDIPGLILAWVILGAVVLAWGVRASVRVQRAIGWTVFGAMFGLIVVNARRAIFPGMPRTPPIVLGLLLPLALPAALAAWRAPDLTDLRDDGPALLALVGAATVLIGVSLTATLTPEYLHTAYRTSLFLHVPVAVPVGIGTVALMARRPFGIRRTVRIAVAGLVITSALISVPLAFGGLAPFNYRSVTTPGELAGAQFAAGSVQETWATDDHGARVARATTPGATVTWRPVFAWLVEGRPPPGCPTLVKRSWTTRGTQFLTTGPIRLAPAAYQRWHRTHAIVYDGGGGDRIKLGLGRDHSGDPQRADRPACQPVEIMGG